MDCVCVDYGTIRIVIITIRTLYLRSAQHDVLPASLFFSPPNPTLPYPTPKFRISIQDF